MSASQKFAIGGLGGLLPLIVSFLSFDPATVITNLDTLTPGIYVGYLIKAIVLFSLGGILAALSDSVTPWTLIQLGIAAPALITSYINGTGVSGPTERGRQATSSIAVISPAYAAEASGHVPIVSVNFLSDVIRGATVPLPKIQRQQQEQERQQEQQKEQKEKQQQQQQQPQRQ
jgi:hypothetical protein